MSRGYTIMPRRSSGGPVRYTAVCRIEGVYLGAKTLGRKSDAELWARETVQDFIDTRHAPHRAAARRTVAELIERYKAEELAGKDHAKPWSPLLDWWDEHFKLLEISSLAHLQPHHIAEGLRRLRRGETLSGKIPAEQTVRGYLVPLSSALTFAVEQQWIRENPVSKVKGKPAKRVREKDVHLIDTQQELPLFLETCREVEDELGAYVVTMLSTGTRRGELLGVRWRDLNRETGALLVQRAKGKKTRMVHVRGVALELLRQLFDQRRPDLDEPMFWPRIAGPTRTNHCRHVFKKARQHCGVRITIHGLRHAFASYALMSGVDLKTVSQLLGHASIETTADVYSHLTGAHLGQAVDKVAHEFLGPEGAMAETFGGARRNDLVQTLRHAPVEEIVAAFRRLDPELRDTVLERFGHQESRSLGG